MGSLNKGAILPDEDSRESRVGMPPSDHKGKASTANKGCAQGTPFYRRILEQVLPHYFR